VGRDFLRKPLCVRGSSHETLEGREISQNGRRRGLSGLSSVHFSSRRLHDRSSHLELRACAVSSSRVIVWFQDVASSMRARCSTRAATEGILRSCEAWLPPDIYHHARPTTITDASIRPFAGISEPFLTSSGRIFDNTIALLPFLRDRSIALMLASAAGELCPAHFLPNPFAPNHSPTSMD
jgi:hypothetical protein